jgi:hypothetical protein
MRLAFGPPCQEIPKQSCIASFDRIKINMDSTFASSYSCRQLHEIPTTALPHYYFPGASEQGGHDGILVEVRPEQGLAWLGTFAYGYVAPRRHSGIYSTPDPDQICVVSRGKGYLVNAAAPKIWECVRAAPITDVRPVVARSIIVFATLTELVAYGSAGIVWTTERLSFDDLKIVEVTDSFIKGEFWDIRKNGMSVFTVDLTTGRHDGGVGEF